MEWLVITLAAVILALILIAIGGAVAAGRAEQRSNVDQRERAAAWEAGYQDSDLLLLAELSAAARVELGAGEVEVVLARGTGDGIVVTGSRGSTERFGRRTALGHGLAGRVLASGEPIAGDRSASVPIPSHGRIAGAVTATAREGEPPFSAAQVAWLAELARETGRRLGPSKHVVRRGRDAG